MLNKYVVEDCHVITIRSFRGILQHPVLKKHPEAIHKIEIPINYTAYMVLGQERKISQVIWFRRTRTHFNGNRAWFSCPSCNQCAYKLYLPPFQDKFKCRECYGLDYELHLSGKKCKNYPAVKWRKARDKLNDNRWYKKERLYKLLVDCVIWEEKAMRYLKSL